MRKSDIRKFDYRKMGTLDAAMWRSYYNHQFFKLFFQLVQLVKTQLNFGWFLTARLAFYGCWAAAYYRIRKKKGVDNTRVLKNLRQFYRLISAHSVNEFDYQKAAELELKWWDVHRKSYKNNPQLEQSLAEATAVVYNVAPARLKTYAHYRAEAMILPRHEGDVQVVATDWAKVESLLVESWRSLQEAVQGDEITIARSLREL